MCVTYYTVNEGLPNEKRSFRTLAEGISHYRTIPMADRRLLGLEQEDSEVELVRCVPVFPDSAEDVLAADYWEDDLGTWPELKAAVETCLRELNPRYLLAKGCLIPVPTGKPLRKDLRDKLLWRSFDKGYGSAIRTVYVAGVGWVRPQDIRNYGPFPLVLSCKVDAMSRDGAYFPLEVDPWEYRSLLERTKRYAETKINKGGTSK